MPASARAVRRRVAGNVVSDDVLASISAAARCGTPLLVVLGPPPAQPSPRRSGTATTRARQQRALVDRLQPPSNAPGTTAAAATTSSRPRRAATPSWSSRRPASRCDPARPRARRPPADVGVLRPRQRRHQWLPTHQTGRPLRPPPSTPPAAVRLTRTRQREPPRLPTARRAAAAPPIEPDRAAEPATRARHRPPCRWCSRPSRTDADRTAGDARRDPDRRTGCSAAPQDREAAIQPDAATRHGRHRLAGRGRAAVALRPRA